VLKMLLSVDFEFKFNYKRLDLKGAGAVI
jgi:hypothetical protein